MKSPIFLDQVMAKNGLKNDAELARHLGWSTGKISQYRSGKRVMDDESCLALAMDLDVNPLPIIAAACIDRAEKTGQKSLFEVFMSRMAAPASALLAVVAVNLFLTPATAEAAQPRAFVHEVPATDFILCKMRRAALAVRRRLSRAKTAWSKWVPMAGALQPTAT